jgi:hypothetical protein
VRQGSDPYIRTVEKSTTSRKSGVPSKGGGGSKGTISKSHPSVPSGADDDGCDDDDHDDDDPQA